MNIENFSVANNFLKWKKKSKGIFCCEAYWRQHWTLLCCCPNLWWSLPSLHEGCQQPISGIFQWMNERLTRYFPISTRIYGGNRSMNAKGNSSFFLHSINSIFWRSQSHTDSNRIRCGRCARMRLCYAQEQQNRAFIGHISMLKRIYSRGQISSAKGIANKESLSK